MSRRQLPAGGLGGTCHSLQYFHSPDSPVFSLLSGPGCRWGDFAHWLEWETEAREEPGPGYGRTAVRQAMGRCCRQLLQPEL